MKLVKVTITGADHSIDPVALGPLSKKYPFVEWGILFSRTRQGQSRYPHHPWIEKFKNIYWNFSHPDYFPINMSCHLCGQWVRETLNGEFTFWDAHTGIINCARRMQLNMVDADFMALDFGKLRETISKAFYKDLLVPDVILQTKRAFQRYEWLRTLNAEGRFFKFDMLYDVSGGKGKLPSNWAPPVDGVFCGYAGGLGPDTLEDQLEKIAAVIGDNKCWIDMESRVRDEDDKFDLGKVERCLEIASKWVTNE